MMKPRVRAIIPRYAYHNVFSKIRMPPVGPLAVLSQISQECHASAIDENNYAGPKTPEGEADHRALQKKHRATIVLLYGGMTSAMPRVFEIAKTYKDLGAITIAGGSHVDALPDEALREGIDIVVHGEGEEAIKELFPALMDGRDLHSIPGISFLANGTRVFTGKRAPIVDLDAMAPTDLTLIKHLEKPWTAIPISRGRGCNFKCEFCVVNTQYGPYKATSPERAFSEVVRYAELGHRHFFFTDDNFALQKEATIKLCRMLGDYRKASGRRLSFTVQVRSEVAEDERLVAAMRYANVTGLCIGYESPIPEDLKAMNKGVTVDLLVRRSQRLHAHFYLHGMLIFGYPSEKGHQSTLPLDERAKAYRNFFREAMLDTIQVVNAIPLPASKLRARLEEEGRLLPLSKKGWDKHNGSFVCYDSRPHDPAELEKFAHALMKRWYLGNPVWNRINYGNWTNWTINATMFPAWFSFLYVKHMIRGMFERERRFRKEIGLSGNVLLDSCNEAWRDIKRRWRNLAIRTYGGMLVRARERELRGLAAKGA